MVTVPVVSPADRPYRLALRAGRGVVIEVTRVHASNSAPIALVGFLGAWERPRRRPRDGLRIDTRA